MVADTERDAEAGTSLVRVPCSALPCRPGTAAYQIRIDSLKVSDHDLCPRTKRDAELIARFVKAMKEGESFPPVLVVVSDGGKRFLVDGFHRVSACRELGKTEIEAKLYDEAFYREALARGTYLY